jgi:hypothetical protein
MTSFHHRIKSGKKGTAAEHAAYISRQGKYQQRGDLVAVAYGNMPDWAAGQPEIFWKKADKNERKNAAAYRELVVALPSELSIQQAVNLAQRMVIAFAGNKPFHLAIHATKSSLEGEINLHGHFMRSDRVDDGIARPPDQIFKRYNAKHPELGGWRKDSCGKTRLELRNDLIADRKTSEELQNSALEAAGHPERVDHRSLKQQGVIRQPEQHLGQAKIRRMSANDKERYVAIRQSNRS